MQLNAKNLVWQKCLLTDKEYKDHLIKYLVSPGRRDRNHGEYSRVISISLKEKEDTEKIIKIIKEELTL